MKNWQMLMAAIAIPLSSLNGWQDLSFRNIPSNKTQFTASGLQIKVDSSASPLIFPFEQTKTVTAFKAEIEIEGRLTESKTSFPEDSYLRIGLVSPGPRRLGFWERQLAPAWILKLFALAPKDSGIDRIYFFNLAAAPNDIGKKRMLPKSKDLIEEQVIAARASEGQLSINYKLPHPLPAAALWISSDGDDTKSKYSIKIKKLTLETAN